MHELPATARALDARIREDIPMARAIDLHIEACDGDTLSMTAPLAPNVNDKGCAFGGSLASLMTVAGWALVVLALEARGLACDVFVARSEIAYRAPVWQDFRAVATLADEAGWDPFFARLGQRGKAHIDLRCQATECGDEHSCATLAATFVAKHRRDAAQ